MFIEGHHSQWDASCSVVGKTSRIGSFTVAIFAYFLASFQPTFWLLFVTLAEESTKGEQKGDEKWAGKWLL